MLTVERLQALELPPRPEFEQNQQTRVLWEVNDKVLTYNVKAEIHNIDCGYITNTSNAVEYRYEKVVATRYRGRVYLWASAISPRGTITTGGIVVLVGRGRCGRKGHRAADFPVLVFRAEPGAHEDLKFEAEDYDETWASGTPYLTVQTENLRLVAVLPWRQGDEEYPYYPWLKALYLNAGYSLSYSRSYENLEAALVLLIATAEAWRRPTPEEVLASCRERLKQLTAEELLRLAVMIKQLAEEREREPEGRVETLGGGSR